MPPKKAPHKPAKKASPSHEPHRPAPHHAAKDARRAYEHLGRIQALAPLAVAEQEPVTLLVSLADQAFLDRRYKDSADLLRAAEHLCFASLVQPGSTPVSPDLIAAIQDECAHLQARAADHASKQDVPRALQRIYRRMLKESHAALHQGSYRRALELARGAEALAHVHLPDPATLPALAATKRLPGAR